MLQLHQTRHCLERIRLARFGVDGISKSLDHICLLDSTAGSDLLDKLPLCLFNVFGRKSRQIRDDQSLEGVAHTLDLFVGPVDTFVFELA